MKKTLSSILLLCTSMAVLSPNNLYSAAQGDKPLVEVASQQAPELKPLTKKNLSLKNIVDALEQDLKRKEEERRLEELDMPEELRDLFKEIDTMPQISYWEAAFSYLSSEASSLSKSVAEHVGDYKGTYSSLLSSILLVTGVACFVSTSDGPDSKE